MEEKKEKEVPEVQELDLEDLEEVSGGRGLRDEAITKTHDITESVKERV